MFNCSMFLFSFNEEILNDMDWTDSNIARADTFDFTQINVALVSLVLSEHACCKYFQLDAFGSNMVFDNGWKNW